MPHPSWDNPDDFLDPGDFGVPVVITPKAGGQPRTINGIPDEPYFDKQTGEYVLDNAEPRLTVHERDAVGLKKYDGATFNGTAYELMHDPLFDGTGTAVLRLTRAE